MSYGYLTLVAAGFALSVLGFWGLGSRKLSGLLASISFIAGLVCLVLGILLTNVPDFFSS
ncbi:hypothetical protein JW921_07480 [Candidatus Fermentibacterales bacterium]|nr:hypothetical protein [Candidatus Fermentibacterales bacterium]